MKVPAYMAWGHRRGVNHYLDPEGFLIWVMAGPCPVKTICGRTIDDPEVALEGELLPNDTCKQCAKIVKEKR